MKFLLVLTTCLVAALAEDVIIDLPQSGPALTLKDYHSQDGIIEERIIDGSPADVGQFPWMVLITTTTINGTFICGGTLISNEWVLSAAHCIKDKLLSLSLKIGGITQNAYEAGSVTLGAQKIIYRKSERLDDDVTVILLSSPVIFTDRISPIRLPPRGFVLQPGTNVIVSGWGRTSDHSVSNQLMFVGLRTITNVECAKFYDDITDSMVCARGNQYENSYRGDSGGPLVILVNGAPTHVGIVSFGANVSYTRYPSVYVRTESKLDWIANHTGLKR